MNLPPARPLPRSAVGAPPESPAPSDTGPRGRAGAASWKGPQLGGDLAGGAASAVVSITGNIAAGVIAFAPLGPQYAGQGILAGMFSSVVAGSLAGVTGGAGGLISGPKATTSIAFAALLSQLLATGRFDMGSPESANQLVALAFGAVLMSGSMQALLGALRFGALVKFIPHPVVSSLRNTAAFLLVYGQVWACLGVERQSPLSLLGDLGQIHPATAAVAGAAGLVAWRGSRFLPGALVPVAALLAGTTVYFLIPLVAAGADRGPLLGAVPSGVPTPDYLLSAPATLLTHIDLLPIVLSGAAAIAVLDAMSSLITLVSYQSLADRRFDGNRQLLGQGVGTMAGALFGALSTSGILARAITNHQSGGRTSLSSVVNGAGVLLIILVLARPLGFLPMAAIAGLVLVIGFGLFDGWVLELLRRALQRGGARAEDVWLDLAIVAFVFVVGVAVNLVAAVGAGVAVSILVFVVRMSRSPVRRVRTGETARSMKRRDERASEVLAREGRRITVIELEGTIFFGSCDALATEIERLAEAGSSFVLVDLKRVRRIDSTGYTVLAQTFQRLRRQGTTMVFTYVVRDGASPEIAENLILVGVPEARLFDSTDRALEYFEEALLLEVDREGFERRRWSLSDFCESWGMDRQDPEALSGYLVERRYVEGEHVVREGEASRSMFLVVHGAAEVLVSVPGERRRRRLSTIAHGTIFGELALLDGLPRTAGVIAVEPLECLELSAEAFERLRCERPETAARLLVGVGRVLGTRLRDANELILELDR